MRWSLSFLPLAAMNLKTKIQLALFMSFTLLSIMGIFGGYYLNRLSEDSVNMMRENYQTLRYTRGMSMALNDIVTVLSIEDTLPRRRRLSLLKAFGQFDRNLEAQSKNITETGEDTLTNALRRDFEAFKASLENFREWEAVPPSVLMQGLDIQSLLKQVYELNEGRIAMRMDDAVTASTNITLLLVILGFIFFLFVVVAMFYFPDYIADPINQLIHGIREIARKNYQLRLPVQSQDEFGELAQAFNDMAAKLSDYENMNVAQIVSEKKRIETIIGQMREAIIGLDNRDTILFANRTALRLLEMDEKEVVGRSALAVARENPLMYRLVKEVVNREVRENQIIPSFDIQVKGKIFYYEKDILQVENQRQLPGQSKQNGHVIILKNVTELREQDLAKTNLMATLSHELKTPISAIDMSLGLLRDERIGKLNEDQQELSLTIRQNTERLLKMVNELLDISRIESGAIEMEQDEIWPSEIVARALESAGAFLKEKGVALEQSIDADLPKIRIDVQKTTGVLINFLTNAIRYSQPGQSIRIRVKKEDQEIWFSVVDQGPGISAEDQQKIFQKYSRARNDKTKGTGLGLAISKEFVEKQGGRIWVYSQEEKGSTFTFSLPI